MGEHFTQSAPLDPNSIPSSTATVPEFGAANPYIPDATQSIQPVGDALRQPSLSDNMSRYLETYERFNKGQGQSPVEAWKNFGNNPETYGKAYQTLASMGGGMSRSRGSAPTMVVNNTQGGQPRQDLYSKWYGRR